MKAMVCAEANMFLHMHECLCVHERKFLVTKNLSNNIILYLMVICFKPSSKIPLYKN